MVNSNPCIPSCLGKYPVISIQYWAKNILIYLGESPRLPTPS